MKYDTILAIETSCDDTSIALVRSDWYFFEILEMISYTQFLHNKFWWVVPEIASREHTTKIIDVFEEIVDKTTTNDKDFDQKSKIKTQKYQYFMSKIDYICYTDNPWLPWSLLVWKTFANTLWNTFDVKVFPTNHIYWHIFSLFIDRNINDIKFDIVVLTASWWHNELYFVQKNNQNKFHIEKIWNSLDDASGECFDKVARMLGWPYPGGMRISEMAKSGKNNKKFEFKRIFLTKDWFNFSFSGFKSQAHNMIEDLKKSKQNDTLSEQDIYDIAFEFQESVVEVLAKKLVRAWLKFGAKTLGIAWWVSCNDRLMEYAKTLISNKKRLKNNINKDFDWNNNQDLDFDIIRPSKKIYSTDNAGMIGVAWFLKKNWFFD